MTTGRSGSPPASSWTSCPRPPHIRDDPSWKVAPTAPGLADRRCEITGPPTKKMTINALNSGASVWMADFEDSTAPSWFNVIDGQINLFDALRGTIDFTDDNGRTYQVGDTTPTVLVRPRGWRLCEKHLSADGRPLPASVVDFGLYLFHNAQWLIDTGAGPYFYLPKLEIAPRGAAVERPVHRAPRSCWACPWAPSARPS